jgi:hypothetical protein
MRWRAASACSAACDAASAPSSRAASPAASPAARSRPATCAARPSAGRHRHIGRGSRGTRWSCRRRALQARLPAVRSQILHPDRLGFAVDTLAVIRVRARVPQAGRRITPPLPPSFQAASEEAGSETGRIRRLCLDSHGSMTRCAELHCRPAMRLSCFSTQAGLCTKAVQRGRGRAPGPPGRPPSARRPRPRPRRPRAAPPAPGRRPRRPPCPAPAPPPARWGRSG